MNRGTTGQYIVSSTAGESFKAFVPKPLPPEPALQIDAEMQELMNSATLALGRLDGLMTILPEPSLFLYMYIRKEAVLSSQIEGTESSLAELLLFENEEAPGVPIDDVQEVSNYVAAMSYGLKRLHEGFPLSNRLIREIHEVLLSKGRGSEKDPGQFRRSQNWIGGSRPGRARYVPPPPDQVTECMSDLEKFLHNEPVKTTVLVKAALAHVQFETIHPFLDGNGRLGRLLITLLMCSEGVLSQPMLYLSLYFKANRSHYYDLLQKVRTDGDWEEWLRFFLIGVEETADQAVQTAKRLLELFKADREKLEHHTKATGTLLRVHNFLQRNPITSIRRAAPKLKLTAPTVTAAFKIMQELGMVRELTGGQRNRMYAYSQYISILSEGTEPNR